MTVEFIRFSGLRGKGLVRVALLPLNLLIAFWQSLRVLFRVRPTWCWEWAGTCPFPAA